MRLNPFDDVALNPTCSRTYFQTPCHCKLNQFESLKCFPPVPTMAAYLRNSS